MIRLLVATRNNYKVGEIQALLGPGFQCLTLRDFPDAPAVVEDADTFAGNATKKAMELAQWIAPQIVVPDHASPKFVLADDSGLEVDVLGGAPGVHSARFAALDSDGKENSADADNNAKLLQLLKGVPLEKRTARFSCVIALMRIGSASERSDRSTLLFDGVCEGSIGFNASGSGGFGYDPLFTPTGFDQTFAELGAEVKNRLSHRAKALAKMRKHFSG